MRTRKHAGEFGMRFGAGGVIWLVLQTVAGAAEPGAVPPSVCELSGQIVMRGDRAVATLTATIKAQVAVARTPVFLGLQRAFLVGARRPEGGLPALVATPEGLTVVAEASGEWVVSLDLEVPVVTRGTGEVGFELGLPRAAVSTLRFVAPEGVGRVTVSPKVAGVSTPTAEEAAALNRPADRPGYPLGPAESLEVVWTAPVAPGGAPPVRSADADLTVRVEEMQIETTATFRLRGAAAEWQFYFPAAADVTAERIARLNAPAAPLSGEAFEPPTEGLIRPTDSARPVWTFRPTDPASDWLLTATIREPRPGDGVFAVGPAAVVGVPRQTGVVRLTTSSATRLTVNPSPGVRRQDAPATDPDTLVYRYGLANPAPDGTPLLKVSARLVPGFVRVQPRHTFRRNEAGWQLTTDLRLTPVRTETEEVQVEVPVAYRAVEARGVAVDEVAVLAETAAVRRLAVRFATPQKTAFDFVLTATLPSLPTNRTEELLLPRFPSAQEQAGRVAVIVPESLQVSGRVLTTDGESVPLVAESPAGGPVTAAAATPDTPAGRVAVVWQPYRPDLAADVRAEINLTERQAIVNQTLRIRPTVGDARPVKLRGPAVGLRMTPLTGSGTVEPAEPGVWIVRPPLDGVPGGEITAAIVYALPLPGRPTEGDSVLATLPLVWPDGATRLDAAVRFWGAGSVRPIGRIEGPWRELPPEPVPERDVLPWLTLVGTGPTLPLGVELLEPAASPPPIVERTLIQTWLTESAEATVRARFALARWPTAGIELDLPEAVVPEIMVDGVRVDPALLKPGLTPPTEGRRVVRVMAAPAARPGPVMVAASYPVALERGPAGARVIDPPRVAGTPLSAARWRLVYPDSRTPLDWAGDLDVTQQWAWTATGFAPVAAESANELEEWLTGSTATADQGVVAGVLTARQTPLGPVRVTLVPRVAWTAACSFFVLVAGSLCARLRPRLVGGLLTMAGVGVALAGVVRPQITGQFLAGAGPGAALLALGLMATIGVRVWQARRTARLPGFVRTPIPGSSVGS